MDLRCVEKMSICLRKLRTVKVHQKRQPESGLCLQRDGNST